MACNFEADDKAEREMAGMEKPHTALSLVERTAAAISWSNLMVGGDW